MCLCVSVSQAQSCLSLCDPMYPPGSSVHGILQARIPDSSDIHGVTKFLASKKKETLPFVTTCINLQDIMPSEIC